MWRRTDWTIPSRTGLVVFLLLAVAVVSTQAQTSPVRQPALDRSEQDRGLLVLRATEFAVEVITRRKGSLAAR